MMGRCYNPNNAKYKNYGARGITVCDEWKHNCKQYCEDVKKLKGYNKELLLQGKIQLDKDYLKSNNKIYSPLTCIWVSGKKNTQIKPSYMWWHYAWNVEKNLLVKFYNIEHFSLIYKEKAKNVSTVSNKHGMNKGWLNGWYIWDKEATDKVKVFRATNINTGCSIYKDKCSKLAKAINKPVHRIYSANRPERSSKVDDWLIDNITLSLNDIISNKNIKLSVIK